MIPTYIYIVRLGDYVKIGRSRDVRRRLRELARLAPGTAYPDDLRAGEPELIATFECDRMGDVERALHDAFGDLRARGEWYRHEGRMVDWCARRKVGHWLDTEKDQDALPSVAF